MQRTLLPILLSTLALSSGQVHATDITLDFNSLPSTQNWVYDGQNTSAPNEAQVFSVSGGVLTQNTLGVSSYGAFANRYNLFDSLTPGLDYTMEVTAKLFSEENSTSGNHWAFGTGYFDGTGAEYSVSLGNDGVETDWGYYTNIDTHIAHTYKLVGHAKSATAAASAELWIDGTFISKGNVGDYGSCTPLGNDCNSVYLGDGTSGPNASGAYYSFSLTATPVPEADAYALMLIGFGLIGFAARRRTV